MALSIVVVLILTFIIYVVSALSYSVKIVGVKTGRIAISASMFSIFSLSSRTATTIQEPLLAKTIEKGLNIGSTQGILFSFRLVLLFSTLGTIMGAILMPTFIKLFSKAVQSFSVHKSVPRLIIHSFSKSGIEQFKSSISKPKKQNIEQLKNLNKMPKKIIIFNIIACSISSVGILASLYSGLINPELRSTCITLAPIINGVATILMTIFIDPYTSMLTDEVIRGECTELQFNRCIIFIVFGLIAGTILAQFLLQPAAKIIEIVARII